MATNPIDLTTVAAVNGWLLQTVGTDTVNIQPAITAFSKWVMKRTGRGNLSGVQSYNERYSGQGRGSLQVKNYPVQTVSSLTVNGIAVPPTPDYIQTGYAISPYGEHSEIVIVGNNARWAQGEAPFYAYQISGMPAYAFWAGVLNVAISYQAGYLLNEYAEAHTVPATPGPYTVTANQGTWFADLGATTSAAVSLAGQYTVAGGIYTFNAALQGTAILLNYQYGGVPYDLDDAVAHIVAVMYRRKGWIDQVSQIQPGIGTTAYSRLEIPIECQSTIDNYTMRFIPS